MSSECIKVLKDLKDFNVSLYHKTYFEAAWSDLA